VFGAALATLEAARRPRYGGELRVEMRATLRTLDPAETPSDPVAFAAQSQLVPMVFETLVRLDERGEPQPWLATSWTHDAANNRWVFAARPNVKLHDGTLWSPPDGIVVPDNRPIEQILRDLARPRNAVVVRSADGSIVGTGPFRIARWEAEKSGALAAHDGYWGGRPYLDAITLQMGRGLAEQATDFQLGKADAVEARVIDLRLLKQRGIAVSVTMPMETLALQFEDGRAAAGVREAVALSIDRAAIHNVMLQKQGEITGALLPRWLSGYSFLFPVERNVARAKQLAPAPSLLAFAYDRQDAMMRAIGERIAVNASEAGIAMRLAAGQADVRLIRLPVTARDPRLALEDLASLLKMALPASAGSPYEAERVLLDGFRVIPLFHLPQAWMLTARVRNWPRLADVWLDGRDKP